MSPGVCGFLQCCWDNVFFASEMTDLVESGGEKAAAGLIWWQKRREVAGGLL